MSQSSATIDVSELIHTPAQLAGEHIAWAEHLHGKPGVPWGIKDVDKHVIPFRPGDMVAIVARPGHGKTSILAYLARAEAQRIIERGTRNTEAVVYVTWEQVTEEIDAVLNPSSDYTISDIAWGRADLEAVKKRSIASQLPIVLIGSSLSRTSSKSPRLYPDVVFQAIESLKTEHNRTPVLLLFDYIQLIPIPRQGDRMKQVTEAAHRCKEIAARVGCPAVVAVQASREVDLRDIKIPSIRDAQWASSIEQTVDKFFSLWRPWLTENRDGTVGIDGQQLPVTEELLILSMRKQRFERGRWTWALHFQPEYLKLCELELRHVEPPPPREGGVDF